MRKILPLVFVILFMAAAALACSEQVSVNPTPTDKDSLVLFQDLFTDPSSGWQTERGDDHVIDYENGGFRIWGNRVHYDYWSIPNLNFTDVQIEVNTDKLGGPDDNSFGVICRYQEENFYGFLISSDGYYGISKRKDGNHQILGADGMKVSPAINRGGSNYIRADCIGSTLTLYVNGEKLLELQDSEFTHGDVGMLAGSFDSPGVDIRFTQFQVLRP
jgi:hypothetical protein